MASLKPISSYALRLTYAFLTPYLRIMSDVLSPRQRNLLLKLRDHIDLDGAAILQYSFASRALVPWCWPLDERLRRVVPSSLFFLHYTHDFDTPYCLCGKFNNVESRIFRAITGEYAGEWVAGCNTERCGYLVPLERYYARFTTMTRKYPLRDQLAIETPPNQRNATTPGGPVRRERRRLGQRPSTAARIARRSPPIQRGNAAASGILKLDTTTNPGLTRAEFDDLFSACTCGIFTTRRVFHLHKCSEVEVIDLTGASDDDSESVA